MIMVIGKQPHGNEEYHLFSTTAITFGYILFSFYFCTIFRYTCRLQLVAVHHSGAVHAAALESVMSLLSGRKFERENLNDKNHAIFFSFCTSSSKSRFFLQTVISFGMWEVYSWPYHPISESGSKHHSHLIFFKFNICFIARDTSIFINNNYKSLKLIL